MAVGYRGNGIPECHLGGVVVAIVGVCSSSASEETQNSDGGQSTTAYTLIHTKNPCGPHLPCIVAPQQGVGSDQLWGKSIPHSNTVIVGDFNTPLKSMDRSSRQKINKATVVLNDTVDQLVLIDIYRTLHPQTAEYTFFPSVHGKFSWMHHILGHKTSLNKFKRIEIISSIFFF